MALHSPQVHGFFSVPVDHLHALAELASHFRRLAQQDDVEEIVCTNTVPIPAENRVAKLTVVSVASAIAEALRRIHDGESVSALFDR